MENLEDHLKDLTYLSGGFWTTISDATDISMRNTLHSFGVRVPALIITRVNSLMLHNGMLDLSRFED